MARTNSDRRSSLLGRKSWLCLMRYMGKLLLIFSVFFIQPFQGLLQRRNFKDSRCKLRPYFTVRWPSCHQTSNVILLNKSLFLSLRFNGLFPSEPGLAGVYWSKGWWKLVTCMQSSSQIITTNKPTSSFFTGRVSYVAQPTVSKHWRENITFHRLAYPKLTWESSNFVSDH